MGKWKACVTMQIRPPLRVELVEFAAREQRSLGNVAAILLEWGLKAVEGFGSTKQLLNCEIRSLIDASKPV
jgi:hypothetical protein